MMADYLERNRVAQAVFAALRTEGLLPGGLLGIDCCETGILSNGFMRCEVLHRSSAVQIIRQTLSGQIPCEHFEIASRSADILAPYESDWLPAGRVSTLAGRADHELFNLINSRNAETKRFMASQLEQLQTVLDGLKKAILLTN